MIPSLNDSLLSRKRSFFFTIYFTEHRDRFNVPFTSSNLNHDFSELTRHSTRRRIYRRFRGTAVKQTLRRNMRDSSTLSRDRKSFIESQAHLDRTIDRSRAKDCLRATGGMRIACRAQTLQTSRERLLSVSTLRSRVRVSRRERMARPVG